MRIAPLFLIFTFVSFLNYPTQAQKASKSFTNLNKKGIIIDGYDPVAFFTENKAIEGSPAFQSSYEGAIYQFASAANKTLFDEQPEKYKVQFGGWCAYAISLGKTAPIDVSTWSIINDRLIFQYSKRIAKRWEEDPQGNLKKADQEWPKIGLEKKN